MSYFRIAHILKILKEVWREGEVRFASYITCMTTSVWKCLPVLDSKSEMENRCLAASLWVNYNLLQEEASLTNTE